MFRRNLAKITIKITVASVVESALESAVDNNTDIVVADSIPVQIAVGVGAWMIAGQIQPYANLAVDKIADTWTARKNAKNAAKAVVEVAA